MSLGAVLADLAKCRICKDFPRFQPALPHEPRPVVQAGVEARICIAGQAPGIRVHHSGKPFTDPSGVRLREWLGMDETIFYDSNRLAIVPMGHCFPGHDAKGGDLPPRKECAAFWRAKLLAELSKLELIVIVGQYALRWHLPDHKYRTLSEAVEDYEALFAAPRRPRIVVLPHPSWRNNSWLKKNSWFETDLLPKLRAEIAKNV